MARPVGFEGADNVVYGDGNEVLDLPCMESEGMVISCWRLTAEELEEVSKTGVVWMMIIPGSNRLPPSMVSGKALVSVGDRPSRAEPVLTRTPRFTRTPR